MEISLSTGINALDEILHGVQPGDNIVYQVDSIEDYIPFVHSFCLDAVKYKRKLIYFRFADHKQLLPDNVKADVFELNTQEGFEAFLNEIFTVIERYGRGACYVFDSLSELAVDWYSDRMLANFFMLTCPYLYDFETGTYFGLLRNRHSEYTINKIHNTAQVILNVHKKDNQIYLHPLKVWKRYSPTMYMLHIWKGDKFIPVLKSAEISEILSEDDLPWIDFTTKTQDIWSRTFNKAYEILERETHSEISEDDINLIKDKLIRMLITRDINLFPKVHKYFTLKQLINIGRRMIGTGMIGGKSVGMLLAQSILKYKDANWHNILETHDSFFIGSDVFYSYLVINKCWWNRRRVKKSDDFLELAGEVCESLSKGDFPKDIVAQFKNMLNYFGQSPIIVRSSSLLEDAYGNSFSGKYDSVFLANQGTPTERLKEFMNAVRIVYQSTMSDDALIYRARRGLLDKDEQMAILVQRVSGSTYGDLFYPQLAGVGYSFNPFVWNKKIDPQAGLIRLVFGLGTRAVDRYDDDYTRIIALNAPDKRPEGSSNEKHKFDQRKVDILDLKNNRFFTDYFDEVVLKSSNLPIEIFGRRDYDIEAKYRQLNKEKIFYKLDLDKSIIKSDIIKKMQEILHILEKAYNYPVDIEFAINYIDEITYKINVLQCRPFQVKNKNEEIEKPKNLDSDRIILQTDGPIIGNGKAIGIDRLIYVVPEVYGKLPMPKRHAVARFIGKINSELKESDEKTMMLLGPGRWATTSPSLGVPVSFQEINKASIICEVAEMHEKLCPDVSLGTHFFNDLVESDMLYVAVYPNKTNSILNKDFLNSRSNKIDELFPDSQDMKDIIKIIDSESLSNRSQIQLYADPVDQKAILYLKEIDEEDN